MKKKISLIDILIILVIALCLVFVVKYFSTNSKRLIFEESKLPQNTKYGFSISAKDITSRTIDKDFEGSKCHKAWETSVKKPEPDQVIKF